MGFHVVCSRILFVQLIRRRLDLLDLLTIAEPYHPPPTKNLFVCARLLHNKTDKNNRRSKNDSGAELLFITKNTKVMGKTIDGSTSPSHSDHGHRF